MCYKLIRNCVIFLANASGEDEAPIFLDVKQRYIPDNRRHHENIIAKMDINYTAHRLILLSP